MNICEGVVHSVDIAGVAIASQLTGNKYFLSYPEAAIWCVLAENRDNGTALKKLSIILGRDESETKELVQKCLDNWRSINLIY